MCEILIGIQFSSFWWMRNIARDLSKSHPQVPTATIQSLISSVAGQQKRPSRRWSHRTSNVQNAAVGGLWSHLRTGLVNTSSAVKFPGSLWWCLAGDFTATYSYYRLWNRQSCCPESWHGVDGWKYHARVRKYNGDQGDCQGKHRTKTIGHVLPYFFPAK